ncbi:MAG TPA: hypothetical protein VL361_06980 [Candidatus Limnocylindrales bacterium]|nr:hypothetical protein [Candidatus Limnocylindrales bacterium]
MDPVHDANGLELQQHLLRRWAELRPDQAAEWASALPADSTRGTALAQVATAWANIDPQAAAGWLRSLPETEEWTTAAVMAFTYEATRSTPLVALEAAGRLAPSPERDAALAHAMSQWASSDPNQAYGWASNIPDPGLRDQLLAVVLTAAADQHGAIAAKLAATQFNPGDEQNRLVVSIIQRWAQTSPETAAGWIEQFPEGPLRSAALENLTAIWSATDPEGAQRWISAMPPGPSRDEALRAGALPDDASAGSGR